MTEGRSTNSELPTSAYIAGSLNGIGLSIYDNIVQYLGVLLGSAGLIQGLITSLRQLGAALLTPIWGRLSDFFGRRQFLFTGNLLLAVMAILTPFMNSALALLLLLTLLTVAQSMIAPAWNGYVGDVTVAARRGHILGKFGYVVTLLSTLGLLIITFLMGESNPLESPISVFFLPFAVSSVAFLFAAVNVLLLPPYTLKKRSGTILPTAIFKVKSNPVFSRLLVVEALFTIAWSSAWPIFVYVNVRVASSWIELGFLVFLTAIFQAVSQKYAGPLLTRFGTKRLILISRAIIITPPLIIVLSIIFHDINYIYFSNAIVGLSLGAGSVGITVIILNSSPEYSKATYFALYAMVTGFSAFFGSTITGMILQVVSGNLPPSNDLLVVLFILAGLFRLVTWFGYFFLLEDVTPSSTPL